MVEDFALLLDLGDGEFCNGDSASFTSFLSSQGRSRAVMVSPVSIPTASLKCCHAGSRERRERKEGGKKGREQGEEREREREGEGEREREGRERGREGERERGREGERERGSAGL